MDIDPHVLLCLMAVRQLGGGQAVPAKQDVFAKGLKKPLQTALEKGWLRTDKTDVATVGKTGKAKTTKQDALVLTPQGEEMILKAGSPDVVAAGAAAQLQSLKANLDSDRQAFRQEILATLGKKPKGTAGPEGKDMAALSKAVTELAKRLEKIETQLNSARHDAVLQHLDEAFARLETRLGQATVLSLPKPGASIRVQPAPSKSLRQVLKQAYDDLCMLIEFEDRLVPLPRLFHQTKTVYGNLTVEAFHRELQDLWKDRQLELQVLNEVRTASEPDKAIRRGDDLFYYVLWH